MTTITDLHRIAGEYLTDARLMIAGYSITAGTISLDVEDDTASVRYAYTLAVRADRYRYVTNIPTRDGQRQIVAVGFNRPDAVFVSVASVHTDPAVIAQLRDLPSARGAEQQIIDTLAGGAR